MSEVLVTAMRELEASPSVADPHVISAWCGDAANAIERLENKVCGLEVSNTGLLRDYLDEVNKVEQLTDAVNRQCNWQESNDPDYAVWETGCGNAFMFETDGPPENQFRFCCYCGGALVVNNDANHGENPQYGYADTQSGERQKALEELAALDAPYIGDEDER